MGDMSGPHVFAEDDNHQFLDIWYNKTGKVTIKVSNGQKFKPMYVVAHVSFLSGGTVVANQDYHAYCAAPDVGGGKEQWLVFAGPGVSADSLTAKTNKEKPWIKDDVRVGVSGSWPLP